MLDLLSKLVICKELRFLALHSVHQDASFELSHHIKPLGQVFRFVIISGDTSDFGGPQIYRQCLASPKTKNNPWFLPNTPLVTECRPAEVCLASREVLCHRCEVTHGGAERQAASPVRT